MDNNTINYYQNKINALNAEIKDMKKELPPEISKSLSSSASFLNKAYKQLEDERPIEGQMTIEDLEF